MLCFLSTAASAANFLLHSGESLDGEVIHATRNTLMVRETIGGIRQLSHSDVRSVEITTQDGDVVSGVLLGWRKGVYEVETGERLVKLQDQRILGKVKAEPPVVVESELPALVKQEPPVVVEQGPPIAVKQEPPVVVEQEPPIVAKQELPIVAKQEVPVVVEQELPVLVVSEAQANEGATEMEFKIGLSHPAKKSIFVVYGTFDRSAKAGEDYREERGALEFGPGDMSAIVRVPLIDDDVSEGDETFEVFVIADKELAIVENKRAVGTILNDDE